MSGSCVFCRIVDGDLPSRTVYEDERVRAFLDANPLAAGHTLVIPEAHHARLNDLPAGLAADLFGAVHALAPAVEAAAGADATTVAVNNGEAAGQEVPHVHCHLIPRAAGDGAGAIHALRWPRPDLSERELDALAEDIREAR